ASAVRRREFVHALLLSSTALLLEACGTSIAPTSPPASTAVTVLQMPSYVPFQGPPADLAGTADGIVPPAYVNYPRNPAKSVQKPVGNGEDVTALMYSTQAPPTPVEQNQAWQRVNAELGVNMKFPIIQLADYPTKLATTISSGSLPDLLSLGAGNGSLI